SNTVAADPQTITANVTAGDNGLEGESWNYEVTVNVANAAQLNFSQQPPSSTEYGSNFTSDVIVQIEDEYGHLVTDATDEVVMSLTDDSDGAAIVGTATVNAVDGVATFADISVNKVGTYTFTATADGLDGGESEEFAITKKDITLTVDNDPAITKAYDGTNTATLVADNYSLTGVESGDVVTVTGTAAYADELVGEEKDITVDGFVLGGADAANYNLTTPDAATTGAITKKDITLT